MGLSVSMRTGAMLTCDKCEETIKDISKAIVVTPDLYAAYSSPVSIFHRGKCAPSREDYPGFEELSTYLLELIKNLQLGTIFNDSGKTRMIIDLPEHIFEY
jgi:hypothetical protein